MSAELRATLELVDFRLETSGRLVIAIDGFCLRSCDDEPCPAGSECRSVAETFGYPMDVERPGFVRR